MSIGQITLDPIKFDVTSGLDGLQGLDNLVEIGHVDVLGGTQEAIQLGINGEHALRWVTDNLILIIGV